MLSHSQWLKCKSDRWQRGRARADPRDLGSPPRTAMGKGNKPGAHSSPGKSREITKEATGGGTSEGSASPRGRILSQPHKQGPLPRGPSSKKSPRGGMGGRREGRPIQPGTEGRDRGVQPKLKGGGGQVLKPATGAPRLAISETPPPPLGRWVARRSVAKRWWAFQKGPGDQATTIQHSNSYGGHKKNLPPRGRLDRRGQAKHRDTRRRPPRITQSWSGTLTAPALTATQGRGGNAGLDGHRNRRRGHGFALSRGDFGRSMGMRTSQGTPSQVNGAGVNATSQGKD